MPIITYNSGNNLNNAGKQTHNFCNFVTVCYLVASLNYAIPIKVITTITKRMIWNGINYNKQRLYMN